MDWQALEKVDGYGVAVWSRLLFLYLCYGVDSLESKSSLIHVGL